MSAPRKGVDVWWITLDATHAPVIDAAWRTRFGDVHQGTTGGLEATQHDRERHAAYRLLRVILSARIGSAAAVLPISRTPAGKPRIEGSDIEFSLSRSGDLLTIAISDTGPVGVDIERSRCIKAGPRRQARVVAAGEAIANGRALPAGRDDVQARYLHAWVRLEALAKATGEGIGSLLTRLGIIGGTPPVVEMPAAGWRIADLDMDAGQFGALATSAHAGSIAVRRVPSDSAALLSAL